MREAFPASYDEALQRCRPHTAAAVRRVLQEHADLPLLSDSALPIIDEILAEPERIDPGDVSRTAEALRHIADLAVGDPLTARVLLARIADPFASVRDLARTLHTSKSAIDRRLDWIAERCPEASAVLGRLAPAARSQQRRRAGEVRGGYRRDFPENVPFGVEGTPGPDRIAGHPPQDTHEDTHENQDL